MPLRLLLLALVVGGLACSPRGQGGDDDDCAADDDDSATDDDDAVDDDDATPPPGPTIASLFVCERADTGICNPGDFPLVVETTLGEGTSGLVEIQGSFWLAGAAEPQVVLWDQDWSDSRVVPFIACGAWPRGTDMAVVAELINLDTSETGPVFSTSYAVNAVPTVDCP
jgi:hypothetical protein